jgi:hypothetical protein
MTQNAWTSSDSDNVLSDGPRDLRDGVATDRQQAVSGNGRRTLSRRAYLAAAAGSVGLGVGGTRVATAARHTLTISGVGEYTTYSFAVSGDLDAERGIAGRDDIDGQYAIGAVGGGTDTYSFTGELLAFDFDRSGAVDVDIDGGPAHVGQRPDYVLEIVGTGDPAQYAFDVGSNLEHTETIGSVQSNDVISGTHAEGEVGGGTDAYLFDGDLEAFSLRGLINAYLNGEPAHVGQRPDSSFDSGGGGGDNGGGSDDGDDGDGGSNEDLKLGYNARERSHDRGNTYEDFGDFSAGWESVQGRVESNPDDWESPADDAGHATLVSDGDNERVEMHNRISSENFAYRDLSMAVRLRGTSNETLRVELAAGDGSERQITTRYLSEKHGWVRIGLGPSAWSGTPDMADINEFAVSCYTGSKTCELDIDDIRTTPKRDSGAVLFVFDDGNRSDYSVAYDILGDRGMVGTSAVIPDIVGDSGNLTRSQIDQMDSDGWAFAAHPQRESPSGGLGSIPTDEAEQEMRDTKQWLLDNTSGRGANTLVWPFGDFDADSLNLAGEYFDLSFGGGASAANGILTEAGWVPRVNTDDVENSLDALETAYKTDTVCALMSHRVGGSRLPESDFRRLLDKVEQRNLDVLTTAEFAAEQP